MTTAHIRREMNMEMRMETSMETRTVISGTVLRVESAPQRRMFCRAHGLPPLASDLLARQRPDASWVLAGAGSAIVARCSLWWSAAPSHREHRVGLIGHYAAHDPNAGAQILHLACHELAAQGCTLAVGPMDGSTHERYRFVTWRGAHPAFFLEPDNPDDWPAHFTDAGFTALSHYYSEVADNLGGNDPRIPVAARRLAARGVRIRPLDRADLVGDLRRIYAVVSASFQDGVLFSPTGLDDFMVRYQPIVPFLRPDLVLLAEREGEVIGFVFAVPDLLQEQRGAAIDTVIIKTAAVHPRDAQGLGLGSVLVARCLERAHALGYRRAIGALMHERNPSRKISAHYSPRVMRRYTLFARPLGRRGRHA